MTTASKPLASAIAHATHSSTLICGERGTGKTTMAVVTAIAVLREGGKFLSNVDINPTALDTIVPQPYSDHWDNAVVRLPDSPHGFALHVEIIGEGWYIHNNTKKYSITLFDECAHYLNSRRWDDEGRQDFIDAMIHQRKRGFAEFYLAHSITQIDSQVRAGYLSSVQLLLNRPPQLSRRWLGGNSPVVCTLKRGSNGEFPTDVTDKKVWTQGLVTTKSYSKSNPMVWNLYSTGQMFDFEHYRSNTSPLIPDGVRLFGVPVHNIFAGYQYVSPRRDSKGNLKRERKQFAFFRMGAYAVISPRLLSDCYYIQSKTIEFFNQQSQHYALPECTAPVFNIKVAKVQVSNNQESAYKLKMLIIWGTVFLLAGGFFYYLGSSLGFLPSFGSAPTAPAVVPSVEPKVEIKQIEPPKTEADHRFKKPPDARFATYPVCEFFNILEQDRVTYFEGKHLIDRDFLLYHFKTNPFKLSNLFIDRLGMPRFSLLFFDPKSPSQVIDTTTDTELFNYNWRSAMVGYRQSYLALYSPTLWIFIPVNAANVASGGSANSSSSSTVFTLPSFAQ